MSHYTDWFVVIQYDNHHSLMQGLHVVIRVLTAYSLVVYLKSNLRIHHTVNTFLKISKIFQMVSFLEYGINYVSCWFLMNFEDTQHLHYFYAPLEVSQITEPHALQLIGAEHEIEQVLSVKLNEIYLSAFPNNRQNGDNLSSIFKLQKTSSGVFRILKVFKMYVSTKDMIMKF